jgi:hypothetical protein
MKDRLSSLPWLSEAFSCGDSGRSDKAIAVVEEVYLNENAPAELKRLWSIRQKWLATKGHSNVGKHHQRLSGV